MIHRSIGRLGRNSARLGASLLLTSSFVIGASAPASVAAQGLSPSLVSELRNGGFLIYIRHASTESDYADQVDADPLDCSTQRTLSEEGWREATLIGASFDVLSIPVGAIYSSQYCRAWQTAELAFGRSVKLEALNFEPAKDYTQDQIEAMKNRVLPILSKKPLDGTNTVVVGHDDPFEAVTGIYPEPQGATYILKRGTDGGVEVVAFIAPDQWSAMLAYR